MKLKLVLAILLCALPFESAFALNCLSPVQVRRGYNGCMQFLKFPLAKQKKVAANTGYSFSKVTWSCQWQKKRGLKAMLASEREVCNYIHRGSQSDGGGGTVPYEPKAPLCQSSGDCRGGYCGAANVCTNGGNGSSCDNSGQCASGYCGAGGTCS